MPSAFKAKVRAGRCCPTWAWKLPNVDPSQRLIFCQQLRATPRLYRQRCSLSARPSSHRYRADMPLEGGGELGYQCNLGGKDTLKPCNHDTAAKPVFRPAGAPCGTWQPQSWAHCVFDDPYERVNVWSHGVPGLLFFALGLSSYTGMVANPGQAWVHNPLGIFCFCAAVTHLGSALTHVYPDSHALEKLDHFGIVALVVGTPVTALMAHEHGEIPFDVKLCFALMLVAALCPPAARVAGFSGGTVAMVALHWHVIFNANLGVQLCLYGLSAVCFLRAKLWEPQKRPQGLYDHHLLHYFVTVACLLHLAYIRAATQRAEQTATV